MLQFHGLPWQVKRSRITGLKDWRALTVGWTGGIGGRDGDGDDFQAPADSPSKSVTLSLAPSCISK